MWHLRGIFVAGAYIEITFEVDVAVACVFTDLCKSVGSICPCSIMPMAHIYNVTAIVVQ